MSFTLVDLDFVYYVNDQVSDKDIVEILKTYYQSDTICDVPATSKPLWKVLAERYPGKVVKFETEHFIQLRREGVNLDKYIKEHQRELRL